MAVILFAALIVGGCGGVIPEAARQGVDPALAFVDLLANPEGARGRRVVFGGEILKVTPRPQETEIEILHYPLRADDSPDRSAPSGGRFLVLWTGFLDPAAHPTGRLLTVAGNVEGSTTRPLGEIQYRYPVIRADYLYLWPRYEAVYPPPPSYYPGYYYTPYYPNPHRPYRWRYWGGPHFWW